LEKKKRGGETPGTFFIISNKGFISGGHWQEKKKGKKNGYPVLKKILPLRAKSSANILPRGASAKTNSEKGEEKNDAWGGDRRGLSVLGFCKRGRVIAGKKKKNVWGGRGGGKGRKKKKGLSGVSWPKNKKKKKTPRGTSGNFDKNAASKKKKKTFRTGGRGGAPGPNVRGGTKKGPSAGFGGSCLRRFWGGGRGAARRKTAGVLRGGGRAKTGLNLFRVFGGGKNGETR